MTAIPNNNASAAETAQKVSYIISEFRRDTGRTLYVCARPGYCRTADGSMRRDGSFKGGPEWTDNRAHALEFTSYLAAARIQGKCPSSKVHPVL